LLSFHCITKKSHFEQKVSLKLSSKILFSCECWDIYLYVYILKHYFVFRLCVLFCELMWSIFVISFNVCTLFILFFAFVSLLWCNMQYIYAFKFKLHTWIFAFVFFVFRVFSINYCLFSYIYIKLNTHIYVICILMRINNCRLVHKQNIYISLS